LRIFPKPCLKCKAIFIARSEYCEGCRLEKKPRTPAPRIDSLARRIKKANLYTSHYKKIARGIKATATHCHLCQQPFTDRNQIQADHLEPGNPLSPLLPAHARCNASRGNKKLER
jgi:hypothetical protein